MSKEFFESKTVVQLKALAKKKKLVLENGLKKAEIVDLLTRSAVDEKSCKSVPPRKGGTKPYIMNILLVDNGNTKKNATFIGSDLFDVCRLSLDFLDRIIEFLVLKKYDFSEFEKGASKICKDIEKKRHLLYWQSYFRRIIEKAIETKDQEEIYNTIAILGEKTGFKKSRVYITIPGEEEIVSLS